MRLKALYALLPIGLIIATSLVLCGSAWADALVTGVRLSPDHRRLIITYEGHIGAPQVRTLNAPSRIVVDVPGATLGPLERKRNFAGKRLRELRIGQRKHAARFVLDYGMYASPQYKLRTIGEYVIVFLSKAGPPVLSAPAQARKPQRSFAHRAPRSAALRVKPKRPVRKPLPRAPLSRRSDDGAATFSSTASPLYIKAAKVVKNELIIEVAKKGHAAKAYRINLDVDWKRLGFKAADIRMVSNRASRAVSRGPVPAHKAPMRLGHRAPASNRQESAPHVAVRGPMKRALGPARSPEKKKPTGPPIIKCLVKPCGYSPHPDK